jgi:hypothetical protein
MSVSTNRKEVGVAPTSRLVPFFAINRIRHLLVLVMWSILLFGSTTGKIGPALLQVSAVCTHGHKTGNSVNEAYDQPKRQQLPRFESPRQGANIHRRLEENLDRKRNRIRTGPRGGTRPTGHLRCETEIPPESLVEDVSKKRMDWWDKRRMMMMHGGGRDLQTTAPIVVKTYINVIHNDTNSGKLSALDISNQMNVLNDAFYPTVQFQLLETTYRQNNTYYNCDRPSADVFKPMWRRGGNDTLNIYTCTSDSFAGFATFPWQGAGSGVDGIVVHYGTFPGGPLEPYINEGKVSHRQFHS